MDDDRRLARARNATAAGRRREAQDPALREIDEVFGRALAALTQGGTERDIAITQATKIARMRNNDETTWRRYEAHRNYEYRRSAAMVANDPTLAI